MPASEPRLPDAAPGAVRVAPGQGVAHAHETAGIARHRRPRRLIFVNRFFHPDHSATSQMLSDLAFAFARDGEDVAVIASRQLYELPNARLPRRETVNNVNVHRAGTTRFGRRAGLVGRAIDYLSFHVTAAVKLFRLARAGDVVVTLTDPPLMSVTTGVVARLKGLIAVNWLQDLYPEVAFRSGLSLAGRIGTVLRWARNCSLHSASINVAIGEQMASRLEREAIPHKKIRTISNWCSDEEIIPSTRRNWLRDEWRLGDKFIVGYSGNLGTAHEADTLLGAAEILRHRSDICFLIVGGGSRMAKLQSEVLARGLTNFVFQPYQTRDQLPATLTLPDIHWLSLRTEFEGLIVPSKFYGVAAAGRPMILIGSETGELARLIRMHGCGFAVAPNDCGRFAQSIVDLADDPALRSEMGQKARLMIEAGYSMASSIEKWKAALSFGATQSKSVVAPLSASTRVAN